MIAYFPKVYPDELLYSLLARYYVKTGYLAYWYVAEDLFLRKTVKPDIEFVNQYNLDAIQMITKNIQMEQVVLKHTMFPYYGRFLAKQRKNNAFQALLEMQGNHNNLLPISKRKDGEKRYLRYCPVCANEDKKRYGETYWHRIHQMQEINICPIHHCQLINSDVIISSKASPALITAEESTALVSVNVAKCENELECRLAEYLMMVFQLDIDLQSEILAGDFLHSKMGGTKYRSVRGKKRNTTVFYEDFKKYYGKLADNIDPWRIEKILTNDRTNMAEICMMGMFLNVPSAEWQSMKLPEKSQEQLFDEAVYHLQEKGLKYPEIARRLNGAYDTVKAIGERKYGTYHKQPKQPLKSGAKPLNWEQIDRETLPLVKNAIKQLQGDGSTRPKKISVGSVKKIVKLPFKQMEKLPLCKNEIEQYQETQEEYWAREVAWAACNTIQNEETFNWNQIRIRTNIRKSDLRKCIPYLEKYADDVLISKIKEVAMK